MHPYPLHCVTALLPSHIAIASLLLSLCTQNINCMDDFGFVLAFTPPTPDHERGNHVQESSKRTIFFLPSKSIPSMWFSLSNSKLITESAAYYIIPQRNKTCSFEQSRNARQYFKQLEQYTCERRTKSELQGNILKHWEQVQATVLFLVLLPHYLTNLQMARPTLIHTHCRNDNPNTSFPSHVN